jgi:DNA-binding IclR family transcriptional regulator
MDGVAALERGLTILVAFGRDTQALTLTELAAATGYYKSTTLRLCASLMRFRFLQRLDDGRFRLGPAVFELGGVYQQSFDMSAFVRPALRRVVDRTRETASFYVRDGDGDVCLYRVESPHPVRDAGIVEGRRFAIDQSACARVLSAFSGQKGAEFDRVRRAVTDYARQSARAPGTAAIACPVFAVGQRLVGALLLSGPESRFSNKTVATMTPIVVDEASRLTLDLGGDPAVYATTGARPGSRAPRPLIKRRSPTH